MVVLLIVVSALVTALAAMGLGSLCIRRFPLVKQEQPVVAFIIGSGLLSLIVFLLCATHLYYRGVILAVAVAGVACLRRFPAAAAFAKFDRFERLLLLSFVPFIVLYVSNAMAPEASPDGSTYHLGIIGHYVRAHGFVPLHTTMYASLSQSVELVYMVAFTFGRHSAAAMLHLIFFSSAAWMMICWGRRTGRTKAAIAAAFLFYASPIAGVDGSSAYIDCATAAILFTVFYLLYLWRTADSMNALLIAAGFLCGYAFGAKYTAGAIILYALIVVRRWKPALVVMAAFCILSAPWLMKNWYYTGNPVAPFFNRIFPNPYQHVQWEADYQAYFKTYDMPDRRLIPWDVTVKGQYLGGLLGPMFLLLPLALLGLRQKEIRQLWLAAAICLIPYPLNIGTRFLLLALPFLALALAETMALANVKSLLPAMMLAHGLLSWPRTPPGLLNLYAGATWRIIHAPIQQALRIEREDRYLSRTQPGYLKARLIDKYVPPGQIVFTLSTVLNAYTSHEIAVFFETAFGETLGDILFAGQKTDRQGLRRLRFHMTPAAVQKIRVEQTELAGAIEQWAISELRFYNNGHELPRASQWRLTAVPNWWEVQAAFDNSPVTRWRTQQPTKPGDYVEVDFRGPQTIDQVDIETSFDHWKTRARVTGLVDGRWTTLADRPEDLPMPPWRFARRMATLEIAARGVHYMLIDSTDYGARDIIDDPAYWGLEELGASGDAHLYHIKPK